MSKRRTEVYIYLDFFFAALYFFIAGTYGEQERWGLMFVWLVGAIGFFLGAIIWMRVKVLEQRNGSNE